MPSVYESLRPRVFAAVLDYCIVYLMVVAISVLLQPLIIWYGGGGETVSEGLGCLLWFAVWGLYAAAAESSVAQATVGKRALRLVVTDSMGDRVTFGKALTRHFAKLFSLAPLGLGILMIHLTERQQSLHDMVAGCEIRQERKERKTTYASNGTRSKRSAVDAWQV